MEPKPTLHVVVGDILAPLVLFVAQADRFEIVGCDRLVILGDRQLPQGMARSVELLDWQGVDQRVKLLAGRRHVSSSSGPQAEWGCTHSGICACASACPV